MNSLLNQDACRRNRKGVAAVEFAVVLPFLLLLTMGIFEIARVLNATQYAENAASVGAYYGARSETASLDASGIHDAAAQALKTHAHSIGVDSTVTVTQDDSWIHVTVAADFDTLFGYPVKTSRINRTADARIQPDFDQ